MMNIINKIFSPFGKGRFWVLGIAGGFLLAGVLNRASPVIPLNGETVTGVLLGSFSYSYVICLIGPKL
jgi:hypothetical protein